MNRRFRINVLLGGLLAALVMIICRWLENRHHVSSAMENGRYLTVVILFAFLYHYIILLRAEGKVDKLPFIRVLLSAVGFMFSIWSVFVLVQAAALYFASEWLDSSLVQEVGDFANANYPPALAQKHKAAARWGEFFNLEILTLIGGLLICFVIAVLVPNRAKVAERTGR